MPWGRMDDKFHRNPKVRELRRRKGGREALGVWVYWWSWCLDDPNLTGLVPGTELSREDEKAAALLVDVGLWDRDGDDFQFHDFAEYNPKRDDIEKKRAADRERVAAKRAASREHVARDNLGDTDASRERVAGESLPRDARPRPVPSRPNPSQPIPSVDYRAREFAELPGPLEDNPEIPLPEKPYAVVVRYRERFEAAKRVPYQPTGVEWGAWDEIKKLLEDTANLRSETVAELGERVLESFFADSFAASKDWPVKLLRAQFSRHVEPPVPAERAAEVAQQRERERIRAARDQSRAEAARRLGTIPIKLLGGDS